MSLLLTATAWEAVPAARALGLRREGGLWRGRGLRLVAAGIGPEAALRALERHRASEVVAFGFCGALKPELRRGDVVADGAREGAVLALRAGGPFGVPVRLGRIASADRVLPDGPAKRAFAAMTGADAVDMETEAVRAWCGARGVPFLSLRSVLDELDDRLPAAYPKRPGPLGLAAYAFSHAPQLPRLLSTLRRMRPARRSLGLLLGALFPSSPAPRPAPEPGAAEGTAAPQPNGWTSNEKQQAAESSQAPQGPRSSAEGTAAPPAPPCPRSSAEGTA